MATWLITGCSSGLGRAIAIAVLEAGHNAVVTARDPETLAELGDSFPTTAAVVPLDVRDHAQVVAAVAVADERFGGVDVLVNNAGYGYRSALEEGDPEEVEQLFATNFFGAVDVMKQVLPGMRERGAGTIVNVSSIAGRTSQPGSGYYSATKFALEGASVALAKEVGPLGVRVVIVEPGGFRTDFAGRSLTQSAHPIRDYADTAGLRRKENDTIDGRQPGDPKRAAEAILQVAASDDPPLRLLLGSDALRRAEGELVAQRAEIDTWIDLTQSTDYPE